MGDLGERRENEIPRCRPVILLDAPVGRGPPERIVADHSERSRTLENGKGNRGNCEGDRTVRREQQVDPVLSARTNVMDKVMDQRDSARHHR